MDAFTRRLILGHVESALAEAELIDVLPTPLDVVGKVVGVNEVVDVADLPDELAARKPRAWRRILGALHFRSNTVFLDGELAGPRRRFTHAHENGHRLLPWHAESFLDDEDRLFRGTEEHLEAEANLAAAYQLFQGHRFFDRAYDYRHELATPIMLASDYGASIHATIRYYVEQHSAPVALAVAGLIPRANGYVPVLYSTQSPSFAKRYGDFRAHLPNDGLGVADGIEPTPLTTVVRAARSGLTTKDRLAFRDLAGSERSFVIEGFSNGRTLFLFAVPVRRAVLGRRLQVSAG